MHYITIIICSSFLALCFTVTRNVSRFKKTHGLSRENLLERESEANSVRKADISDLPYIKIPLDTLPLPALSACNHAEHKYRSEIDVRSCQSGHIICLR